MPTLPPPMRGVGALVKSTAPGPTAFGACSGRFREARGKKARDPAYIGTVHQAVA